MQRKITEQLERWQQESAGQTAALIVGARRVGKSYSVKKFAESHYDSHILIDFSNTNDEIRELFIYQSQNLDTFFTFLQEFFNVRLIERRSVIIFDEVQLFPPARQLIKQLVADGRYDYIETGSLMSIRENVKDILIPSEEREFAMHPLDFDEFCDAIGESLTKETIRYAYENKAPLGPAVHRKIMTLFRQYLITGGMPQAVQKYIDTKNFREVDGIKRDILNLYRNDIYKHGGKNATRVTQVFDYIPAQLSAANKRFVLSALDDGARLREYEDALVWLSESKTVNLCVNTTEPTTGLMARADSASFKCYQADTGLLLSQTFSAKDLARDEIYKKLLVGKLEFNNGLIVENAIAQMLTAAGHPLFYFADTTDRMEIDFLLTKNSITSRKNIIPIEVKSGKHYLANSLNKFRQKFPQQIEKSIILYDGDIKEEDNVIYLPLYMAGLL